MCISIVDDGLGMFVDMLFVSIECYVILKLEFDDVGDCDFLNI